MNEKSALFIICLNTEIMQHLFYFVSLKGK